MNEHVFYEERIFQFQVIYLTIQNSVVLQGDSNYYIQSLSVSYCNFLH